MSCDVCGGAGHQCDFEQVEAERIAAVEKAVREEREAVVRWLVKCAASESPFHQDIRHAIGGIKQGEHRK